MFKRILLSAVPMVLFAGGVFADDDLLKQLASENTDVVAAVADDDVEMGKNDVDQLMGDAEESSEETIAACYSRISYRYPSYGYHSSYPAYSYPTYSYHRYPTYRYNYRPVVYKPVHHTYYTPVYTSYWGCY